MRKIVLIGCVKKKRSFKCRADEMYISDFFKKNLAYAKSLNADDIFILSAKYGLLKLDSQIEPYDLTLNKFNAESLRDWSDHTILQLEEVADLTEDKFVILAGNNYRKHLIKNLKDYEIPLEGLGIGKQLQFLKNKIG